MARPYYLNGPALSLKTPLSLPDGNRFQPGKPAIVQFYFKSYDVNSILFQILPRSRASINLTSVDYMTVGFSDGFLSLSYNYGCGFVSLTVTSPLNDGLWHSAVISRACNQAVIVIDSGIHAASTTPASNNSSPDTAAWLTVFSPVASHRRAGTVVALYSSMTRASCANRCLDNPYCQALNYGPVFSQDQPLASCELLLQNSSTVIPSTVDIDSPFYEYYYNLLSLSPYDFSVAGPVSSSIASASMAGLGNYVGCVAGIDIDTWAIDIARLSNTQLDECR